MAKRKRIVYEKKLDILEKGETYQLSVFLPRTFSTHWQTTKDLDWTKLKQIADDILKCI